MKTTVHLDDRVALAAKAFATKHGISFSTVVDTALREFLGRSRRPPAPFKLKIQSRDTGPRPGVNIEDRTALWNLIGGP